MAKEKEKKSPFTWEPNSNDPPKKAGKKKPKLEPEKRQQMKQALKTAVKPESQASKKPASKPTSKPAQKQTMINGRPATEDEVNELYGGGPSTGSLPANTNEEPERKNKLKEKLLKAGKTAGAAANKAAGY